MNKIGLNISKVHNSSDVPVFYDSVWVDNASRTNFSGSASAPQPPTPAPPDLTGTQAGTDATNSVTGHDQYRIWIARHNRGINMAFACGSARWVPLEETYDYYWTPTWTRFAFPKGFLPQK